MKFSLSAAMLAAESNSFFNSSKWSNEGECTLKELWAETHPGLTPTSAKVILRTFSTGDEALKLLISCEGGTSVELPLSRQSSLLEGDEVNVDSITATFLTKEGSNPIWRYDGEKK